MGNTLKPLNPYHPLLKNGEGEPHVRIKTWLTNDDVFCCIGNTKKTKAVPREMKLQGLRKVCTYLGLTYTKFTTINLKMETTAVEVANLQVPRF